MKSRLGREDTKSPDFFSSEASNISFEYGESDGSTLPIFALKISTYWRWRIAQWKAGSAGEDAKQSPDFISSEASNIPFDGAESDGSTVPLLVLNISTH